MIRLFLIFVISFTFLQSETFEERQKTLQDIKSVIQYEESVARIYELYILNNLKLPTIAQINTLLGGNVKDFITIDDKINEATLTSGLPKITYALGTDLIAETSIKSLYDSNTYRKKTYVRGDAVYFILEDIFAKHLFDLIAFNDGNEIEECNTTLVKACIYNNHIYIVPTYTSGSISGYWIAYHIDKFKTGPIVVTDDTSKHSEEVFKSIAKGTLIYDITGVKYIKTTLGIEVLK